MKKNPKKTIYKVFTKVKKSNPVAIIFSTLRGKTNNKTGSNEKLFLATGSEFG
jgi:hypothetical protein